MPAVSDFHRTRRGFLLILLGLTLLAGCTTPREALTPGPEPAQTGDPLARLIMRDGDDVVVVTPGRTIGHRPWEQAPIRQVSDLPDTVAQAWRATQLSPDSLSLVVMELGQAPWIAIQPQTPRNPASLMKLVTTYAALEGLGPEYRWRTELAIAPGTAVDAQGRLQGPLYLLAGGDPWLRTEDLWRLLRELRVRGIRSIPEIVIDRSAFGEVAIDPGAFDNAPDRVYNAGPDALIVGHGATRLQYWPSADGRAWQVALDPELPNVRIDNRLQARAGACTGQRAVSVNTQNSGQQTTVRIDGSVPTACGSFHLYRLLLDPASQASQVITGLWQQMGGELTGPITRGHMPEQAEVIAVHESPPLGDIVRPINKASNNVMARLLLLTLGREYDPAPATPDTGRAALQDVLQQQGLVFPELFVENGSGLSRTARISAGSLATLLDEAWLSARMPEFVSSMAIAGADGTVSRRWRNAGPQGRAHLKTGTLRDVNALAGYVQGASGRRYLVVSMVNDPRAYNARQFVDRVVQWLSQQ